MVSNDFIRDKNVPTVLADICKGKKESLEILQKNSNIHWSNIYSPRTKETPLHLAAQYGHIELISYLLNSSNQKFIDVRNIDNKTPLHDAAQFGKFDCVRMLVENGADINAIKRSDWTPLMLACTKPDINFQETVEYLVQKGALLNFKNKDGWTSLHLAARNENSSILSILLRGNIDTTAITNNGRTALHISALHGNLQNVKLLVPKTNINFADFSGNTPFHEAVLSGNIEMIEYLVTSGADVSVRNKSGSNGIHLASGMGLVHVIKYLMDKCELDINETNLNGHTGLHCAARKGKHETFKILIELGADPEISDKCGRLAEEYLSR